MMNMKNIAIAGLAALALTVGLITGTVVSDNKPAYASTTYSKYNSDNQVAARLPQMAEETAKEAELSLTELEKLDICQFNLPSATYKAYVAEKISVTDTGIILTSEDGNAFQLKKGDIVRVNSVGKNNSTDNYFFNVGYVKDGVYTSTTCGSTKSPVTAWEILEEQDAGDYKIYIKSDNMGMSNVVFDFIITVEQPKH